MSFTRGGVEISRETVTVPVTDVLDIFIEGAEKYLNSQEC